MNSVARLSSVFVAILGLSASAAHGAGVVNGDFSAGNTGFTSGYGYASAAAYALWPEGVYSIVADPHDDHPLFASFGDHTGGGKMMVVNGAPVAGVSIWNEDVSGLTVGQTYSYSFWLASAYPANPAVLSLLVNGSTIGSATATTTTGLWNLVSANWIATSTTADLGLIDQNTIRYGNDFALDDIRFTPTRTSTPDVEAFDAGVPEPATWALMLIGVGMLGGALRWHVRTNRELEALRLA